MDEIELLDIEDDEPDMFIYVHTDHDGNVDYIEFDGAEGLSAAVVVVPPTYH